MLTAIHVAERVGMLGSADVHNSTSEKYTKLASKSAAAKVNKKADKYLKRNNKSVRIRRKHAPLLLTLDTDTNKLAWVSMSDHGVNSSSSSSSSSHTSTSIDATGTDTHTHAHVDSVTKTDTKKYKYRPAELRRLGARYDLAVTGDALTAALQRWVRM